VWGDRVRQGGRLCSGRLVKPLRSALPDHLVDGAGDLLD
jgi:hypothetical protein